MSCNEANDDRVAAYVAGVLPEDELAVFESHLLGCDACRDAVRQAAVIRRALDTRGRSTARPAFVWVAGIVAAASIAFFAIPWPPSPLVRLGAISPHEFHGAVVRSSADSTGMIIDRGMAAYSAGDFRSAARDLAAAAASDSSPALSFYLGVALLMRNDPARALTAFARAQRPELNPFAADAQYFAAKSWLRLNNADSALAVLDRAVGEDEVMRQRFMTLRDSVRRLRR
ncbi:MAG: tetratricopeptide repeat protein [Gemmatimonadaceae bacterium]